MTLITHHRTNGIPTGTTLEYACRGCQREFAIESVWGVMLTLIGLTIAVGLGVGFGFSGKESTGWRIFGLVVMLISGVGLFSTINDALNRRRFPVIDAS